jgi:hypothetical protein
LSRSSPSNRRDPIYQLPRSFGACGDWGVSSTHATPCASKLARFRETGLALERWRSAAGIRVSWRRHSATILPLNRRDRWRSCKVSSSKSLLHSLTATLDVHSAIFWSWLVLGVKPVLFRLHDDNPPGDGGQRLALPGQGLRLLWGIHRCQNGAQRQALVSPVIERARHEGL